jgi:hypothetical protein
MPVLRDPGACGVHDKKRRPGMTGFDVLALAVWLALILASRAVA